MLRRAALAAMFLGCISVSVRAADQTESDSLRLTLPPTAYAVVGAEMNVYFDNIVLTETPEELRFVVTSDLGTTERNRWTVTPTDAQVGTHTWQVEVLKGDQSLATGKMTWHVSPARMKKPKEVSLLIVGDSLTAATIYPNELANRIEDSGLSKWTMFGTHLKKNALPGVAHEGYGGWTWKRFVTHFESNPNRSQGKHSSPFVYLEGDSPKLDVPRYIREVCGDQTPDYVIVLLGINDCFGADPNTIAKTDPSIDTMFQHAETLLQAFHEAAPDAQVGLCLTPPGNVREAAFLQNYKGKYPRWGWKRIQHRLVERQLAQFGGERSRDWIGIIPTELNLDPVSGFPENNAVHPNAIGYQQIGATIHAWMMSRLTTENKSRE